ncbi:hypothetical protein ABT364_08620 [Massilia sp. SR12]
MLDQFQSGHSNESSSTTYGYDTLDRLTSAVSPSAGISYAYDKVGNRLQKVINSSVTNSSYAVNSNRLIQVGTQAIVTDANGSITDKGNANVLPAPLLTFRISTI